MCESSLRSASQNVEFLFDSLIKMVKPCEYTNLDSSLRLLYINSPSLVYILNNVKSRMARF